jgi:prepilin-type N-terminal cleavage/methylation domain-containing protein/prepilin-type processing-associated H-X9-DG protein
MKSKFSNKSGFTLVELLVVIAIIAILAGLAMTVTNVAMKKGQATKCLSNVRQVGIAVRAYVNDHDGQLPDTGHVRAADGTSLSWLNTLGTYLGPNFIGRCPSHPNANTPVSFAWNDLLTDTDGNGIASAKCQNPASTIAVGETADTYASEHFHFSESRSKVSYNQFKSSVAVERHNDGANYVFVDGHAEYLSSANVKARLAATDSTFLTPIIP